MSRLMRDGIAEPVSRDQILRRELGQGNINFPCSVDHVDDWQPYPVHPYSCYMSDNTHTYIVCNLIPGSKTPRTLTHRHTHGKVAHPAFTYEYSCRDVSQECDRFYVLAVHY